MVETGGVIELPPEAGLRRIVIQPVPKKAIASYRRKQLAGILIYDHSIGSEELYNEAMNNAIPNLLMRLGAVNVEIAKVAAKSVDGIWWDSKLTLPDVNLVIRRNMDMRTTIVPWLTTLATPKRDPDPPLVAACGRQPKPVGLSNPNSFGGVQFPKHATVEIEVQADLAERMQLESPHITQADFPRLIERIAVEAKAAFGPNFDKP